jgi:hypothetical protein
MVICRTLPHLIAEISPDIREQLSDFLTTEIARRQLEGPLERPLTAFERGLSTLAKSLGSKLVEIGAASEESAKMV